MTIQEMTANFDLLAHSYFYCAIAYVLFLFCCHLIEVFQALKAEYEAKLITEASALSKPILELPSSNQMTLRQLREYVRIHNLQTKVKSSVGLSVSHCSKAQLISALS